MFQKQRAVEVWKGQMAYLRLRREHQLATMVQAHFRRWQCRDVLNQCYLKIIAARKRQWRELHRMMDYCDKDTPGCYSVDKVSGWVNERKGGWRNERVGEW